MAKKNKKAAKKIAEAGARGFVMGGAAAGKGSGGNVKPKKKTFFQKLFPWGKNN